MQSNHTLEDEMTGCDAQHDPEFIAEGDVYTTSECIFEDDNLNDCYELKMIKDSNSRSVSELFDGAGLNKDIIIKEFDRVTPDRFKYEVLDNLCKRLHKTPVVDPSIVTFMSDSGYSWDEVITLLDSVLTDDQIAEFVDPILDEMLENNLEYKGL